MDKIDSSKIFCWSSGAKDTSCSGIKINLIKGSYFPEVSASQERESNYLLKQIPQPTTEYFFVVETTAEISILGKFNLLHVNISQHSCVGRSFPL